MEEESGMSTATGTMRIDDVGESTLLGAAAAGGADTKGLSPGEHVLSFMDAERFVEELRTFDCREIGTPAWMAQHTRLEKLNLQSHQCALANSDDFVLEALVSFDKVCSEGGSVRHAVYILYPVHTMCARVCACVSHALPCVCVCVLLLPVCMYVCAWCIPCIPCTLCCVCAAFVVLLYAVCCVFSCGTTMITTH